MKKIEPIILDNVKYNTSACAWTRTFYLDNIPASKVLAYEPKPEDFRVWDRSIGDDHTHIVKFSGVWTPSSVQGANNCWHAVREWGGKKSVDIACYPLCASNFVEIWQRSSCVRQVEVSYEASHSAGYCLQDVAAKAKGLRKQGLTLKDLPYDDETPQPSSSPKKHYLADFAAQFA